MSTPHEILLPGLDGATPLGFLAALGTWRTTDCLYPGTRMYCKPLQGHWSPVLLIPTHLSNDEFATQIQERLEQGKMNEVFFLNKDLKIPVEKFRRKALELQSKNDRDKSDWMSALGSDACFDKWKNIQGSSFDLMNAGKQYFLETIEFLIENTSVDDIKNTLFEKWAYVNKRGGMRWDLEEDRRYALRWKDPQADTTNTQWGANRLAIESLPLLQTSPAGHWLETAGFVSKGKKNTFFTWPIWRYPITTSVFKSVIGSVASTSEEDATRLHSMGIGAVFKSQRIWKGNPPNDYSNFTPAVQLC